MCGLFQVLIMAVYKLEVTTGDMLSAGTSDHIFATLVGTDGVSKHTELDNYGLDFRTSQTSSYKVKTKPLGRLLLIKLEKERFLFLPERKWFCSKIVVRTPEEELLLFPCYRWVSRGDCVELRGAKAMKASDDDHPLLIEHRKKELAERSELYHVAELGVKTLFGSQERLKNLESINTMFTIQKSPTAEYVSQHWREDAFYGYQFLNGLNPTVIRNCSQLPSNFPVTEEMVQPFLKAGTSLHKEIKKGNIFLCDYKIMEGLPTPVVEGKPLFLAAALCLLYLDPAGTLKPIAIQLGQKPSEQCPIFVPSDAELDWVLVKMFLKNTDTIMHQVIAHLQRTHLLAEVFAVATMRHFPAVHPLYKLLFPHFRDTLEINIKARDTLIGLIGSMSSVGVEGLTELIRRDLAETTYSSLCLPENMAERGLENIPNFHYRDDGLKLWKAINSFVRAMLGLYYPTDDEVCGDAELQRWIQDIFSKGFLGNSNSGIPQSFNTVEEVVKFVTMVIFLVSAQHAAVNNGQFDYCSWMPNNPYALVKAPPTTKGLVTMDTIMENLPPMHYMAQMVALTWALTKKYAGTVLLGSYPEERFGELKAKWIIENFQKELSSIDESITTRNAGLEIPYNYLKPSQMENSSLRNKVDELQANVKFLEEYKNACLLAITETWLKDHDSQSDLRIDGFGEPVRLDRDPTVTGKSLGGGLALYVNRSWCGNVIVRESLCAPDIELLSVSLRPFYLPREFTQLFVTLVYIHPKANVDNAVRAITRTVLQLQALSPDAPNFIMGDFNNCKPGKHLGNFHQYVTCATRLNKCLDLCYGSIKGAYKSLRRASLGASDHNTVYLVPSYKSVLKRHKPERRLVPVWTEESIGRLQDCYACTDWDLFKNSCKTVDEITETVSDYVKFCEELCIHKKSISIFPNNKPWVSKSVPIMAVYILEVTTGDMPMAGTSDLIFATLVGTDGVSERTELNNYGLNFWNGRTSSYKVKTKPLGRLLLIKLDRFFFMSNAGWFCSKIVVRTPEEELLLFPCYRWVSKGKCVELREAKEYVSQHWKEDAFYGYQFLNGLNPTVITNCSQLPSNFPVTEKMVQPFLKAGTSLHKEIKKGNIFLCDYKIMEGLQTRVVEGEPLFLAAALCLLYLDPAGTLQPIAIQLGQKPSEQCPIFVPSDAEWVLVKMFVKNTDTIMHQVTAHLQRTHLLAEVFAVATMRHFPAVHPLYKLLFPHFRDTLEINIKARDTLIGLIGSMPHHFMLFLVLLLFLLLLLWLLMLIDFHLQSSVGVEGLTELIRRDLAETTYSSLCLPENMAERGLENIPNFHYRDDGLKLWKAINSFVRAMLGLYYPTDDEVCGDTELQRWIQDIFSKGFLGNSNSGMPGVVGATDGTDIQIIAPSKDEDVIVNRKNVHSINTQIVFDATFYILDVAKWPAGSTRDPRILMGSGLRQLFERHRVPVGCHLLGLYVRAHKNTRNVVERGIGQMKRRFHVLHAWRNTPQQGKYSDHCRPMCHSPQPSFNTVEEVVKFITMVIFLVSAQHAAVNNGQLDYSYWIPNSPYALVKAPPTTKGLVTMDTIVEYLAPIGHMAKMVALTWVLTKKYAGTVLFGSYPEQRFGELKAKRIIENFQKELSSIDESITTRNAGLKIPYNYLKPSEVENSASI
ncbi:Arachidonate 15-lipoxygenase B [Merluccius polli]|uniref:Arachidonate 15-lipoxygenase B n=1 Tax=Merluccius polli TaxID=89951 RepID=A0AA47NP98_MERPO|nr:Arachidonate 15-lipoxygenase B [Merluccius polli]